MYNTSALRHRPWKALFEAFWYPLWFAQVVDRSLWLTRYFLCIFSPHFLSQLYRATCLPKNFMHKFVVFCLSTFCVANCTMTVWRVIFWENRRLLTIWIVSWPIIFISFYLLRPHAKEYITSLQTTHRRTVSGFPCSKNRYIVNLRRYSYLFLLSSIVII